MQFKQMTSTQKALVIHHNNNCGHQHPSVKSFFEHNKYQIFMFLIELLAKKVCGASFVSQYIFTRMFNIAFNHFQVIPHYNFNSILKMHVIR